MYKRQVFTSWFTGSEDGQIQVDRNAAAAYIAALAAKYDTAGTARVFHTATGKDVTLTGPYGWKLNQATEVEAVSYTHLDVYKRQVFWPWIRVIHTS